MLTKLRMFYLTLNDYMFNFIPCHVNILNRKKVTVILTSIISSDSGTLLVLSVITSTNSYCSPCPLWSKTKMSFNVKMVTAIS